MRKIARFGAFFFVMLMLLQSISTAAIPAISTPGAPALSALVGEAEGLDGVTYTNVSWRGVLDAIADAERVLADAAATQDALDTAYAELRDALDSLVTIASFGNPFSDVSDADWFLDAVLYANANGLMTGAYAGRFAPDVTLSRAMMVTVLYRIEAEPDVSFAPIFDDVSTGAWYSDAVMWATQNEIVMGIGAGRFAPQDPLTREGMATILHRYARFKQYDMSAPGAADLDRFSDRAAISDWAADGIRWAVHHGLVRGYAGMFMPSGTANRAACAVLLQRFIDRFEFDRQPETGGTTQHHINWTFSIYSEPDHRSRRIATLQPQTVEILEETTGGWARIPTGHGVHWVYLRANRRHIGWRFSLYAEPEFRSQRVMTLDPTTLTVLELRPDGWARVCTYRGNLWVYTNMNRRFFGWRFSLYAEPDLRSQRMMTLDPTTLNVHELRPDGWARVSTYRGSFWTYTNANRRYMERPMGLFVNRGGTNHEFVLAPQIVTILAQEANWIQISTYRGPRWTNLDFTPPTQGLDSLLRRHGNSVSVYFANIESGFVYRYNPTRIYHGASVPKAFFSMYIYEKADRGETNLDTRIRFTNGGHLTQREMLRRNLMHSCNASTLSLRDFHGTAGFRRWVSNLGANPNWVRENIMGHQLTVNETAIFAWAIYHYIESNAPHAAEFRRHLLNNQIPFIVSDYPVASKTGWTNTVFHDMAIVYADSPYILIILSQRANHAIFREISREFQRFNDTWFVS